MRNLLYGILSFACCLTALFVAGQAMARTYNASGPLAASAAASEQGADHEAVRRVPLLRDTQRISIPYGFDSPLPLDVADQRLHTSGAGACTAGEEVTIAATVTQTATGAIAEGEKIADCTGEEQAWWATAFVQEGPAMTSGDAEACGVAITRENGEITDTFEWCTGVTMRSVVYLPLVIAP